MAHAASHFAGSYAEARAKFLAAAEAAGLDVEPHVHPLRGRDGETLAMDVALDGARDARRLLIVSSGCHGVEGFCGSGVQHALLQDEAWRQAALDAGVAVLHIHALNPYGFSWIRRVTQENVDLNRNFCDFARPLPANPAYDEIAGLLTPATWPPPQAMNERVTQLIAQRGLQALQAATSAGQYDHPEGLFYGGRNPTWSNQALRHVLQDHGRRCERLAWVDLHTGLGPRGLGEPIFAGRDDPEALARARAWWGPSVTSVHEGTSSSSMLTGTMAFAAYEECPQAEFTGITLEFGTVPILEVIDALRADQWLELHPEAPPEMRAQIKQRLREAFHPADEAWQAQVLEQAVEAAAQAVRGLERR